MMANDPAPISGQDLFHVMYGSTFKFDKKAIPGESGCADRKDHKGIWRRQERGKEAEDTPDEALARRYLDIGCSVMTPRIQTVWNFWDGLWKSLK